MVVDETEASDVVNESRIEEDKCSLPKPRRIIRRRRTNHASNTTQSFKIDPILLDKVAKGSALPSAYSFEIEKTVKRCVQLNASHIALQFPEGLLMYATVLGDVLKRLTPCLEHVTILTDVTYGACCVDDRTAASLGCQLLVHYGHSCLVPMPHTKIPCLYVFVEVEFDIDHMIECLKVTLLDTEALGEETSPPPLALLGTVQFRHALMAAAEKLTAAGFTNSITVPQVKPLSPGEVLGCTSPSKIPSDVVVLFVADGRFHLESTLIANPQISGCYRYDPYGQTLTKEVYGMWNLYFVLPNSGGSLVCSPLLSDHSHMHSLRQSAIAQARTAQTFGIILGTLGRQGNPAIVEQLLRVIREHADGKDAFVILLPEILPQQLAYMQHSVDAWIQVACPRLSVDWGHLLCTDSKPVLNPYEAMVALDATTYQERYPMDYYSHAVGGPWGNYHKDTKHRQWGP